MTTTNRALFLSHGGGPMPLLGDHLHQEMLSCLKEIANSINKPKAIIVFSAHWEESVVKITSANNPTLFYDYYGFPAAAYDIQYACAGLPKLARDIQQVLTGQAIHAELDELRGLDHGVFVPLKIMYPDADIPCLQISLLNNLEPAAHIKLGQALQALPQDNLLMIGSGFSFHNMKAFFAKDTAETKKWNQDFEHWLIDTCTNKQITENERSERLINWQQAPSARYCHPREEHLLPLHVCYGFAGKACSKAYQLTLLNKKSSMYLW